MLKIETIHSIVKEIVRQHTADPNSVYIEMARGMRMLKIHKKVTVMVGHYGFSVYLYLHEKNPYYSTARTAYQDEYVESKFTLFNPFGPLSKVYRLMTETCHKNNKRIRDEQNMNLMSRINKVIDIDSIKFEEQVLKGDSK